MTSGSETSIDYLPSRSNNVVDLANLVLRLLPSKDGAVLRRLLMTVVSAIDLYLVPFLCYTIVFSLYGAH